MKAFLAIVLAASILLCISGCTKTNAVDLMSGYKGNTATDQIPQKEDNAAITDFSVRLFRASMEDEKNTLISPLSVLTALAMTANGAEGETLSQMEETFGISVEELNVWLAAYMAQLPNEDTYKLSLANSIWFKDDPSFQARPEFLQNNADHYGAGIYKAPFDESTLKEINEWVEDKTDGMITDILDQIPESAVMYLVNALAFDAQWQTIYEGDQIRNGTFTAYDGTRQKAEMMHATESLYIEDAHATGFIKYYDDCKYAFAALLPDEDVSIDAYVESLNGEHLSQLLAEPQNITVYTQTPKFKTEYSVEMAQILSDMGMQDAFNGSAADFDALGTSSEGNIYISRVLHKAYISVDAKGTQAGAATVVEMDAEGSAAMPMEYKTVTLDRPFVYMVIDCENNIPFFIGTLMNVQ